MNDYSKLVEQRLETWRELRAVGRSMVCQEDTEMHVFAIDCTPPVFDLPHFAEHAIETVLDVEREQLLDVLLWTVHESTIETRSWKFNNDDDDGSSSPRSLADSMPDPVDGTRYHLHVFTGEGNVVLGSMSLSEEVVDRLLSVRLYLRTRSGGARTEGDTTPDVAATPFRGCRLVIQTDEFPPRYWEPCASAEFGTGQLTCRDDESDLEAWAARQLRRIDSKTAYGDERTNRIYRLKKALTRRICELVRERCPSLRPFFEAGDVEGCAEAVRDVSALQLVRRTLKAFELMDSRAAALHTPFPPFPRRRAARAIRYDPSSITPMSATCFISCVNIRIPCFAVRVSNNEVWNFDVSHDRLWKNPFGVVARMIECLSQIEPYMLDYETTLKLRNDRSSFTRERLIGYYMLPVEGCDLEALLTCNDQILGDLLVEPYVDVLWHVVFLYCCAFQAPRDMFADYRTVFLDAIRFVIRRVQHNLVLNVYQDAVFVRDDLDVCLWYVAEVSHVAFPDGAENLRKSWNDFDIFEQFYVDAIRPDFDPPATVENAVWHALRFLRSASAEVAVGSATVFDPTFLLAHHYDRLEASSGTLVLFSDPQPESPPRLERLKWAAVLGLEKIKRLVRHSRSEYDDLKREDDNRSELTGYRVRELEDVDAATFAWLERVAVDAVTCRPVFPVDFDGEMMFVESLPGFFQLFHDFCVQHYEYPNEAVDLLACAKEYILLDRTTEYPVFRTSHLACCRVVFDKFVDVMHRNTVTEYINRHDTYRDETLCSAARAAQRRRLTDIVRIPFDNFSSYVVAERKLRQKQIETNGHDHYSDTVLPSCVMS